MSAILYGVLSKEKRKVAFANEDPDLKNYLDVLTSLVPADVLVIHAVILSFTTTQVDGGGSKIIDGTAKTTLIGAWFVLIALSWVLFCVPKLIPKVLKIDQSEEWDKLDYARMVIPSIAFIGWSMLQKMTAFDAVFPEFPQGPRTLIAIIIAILLIIFTSFVSMKVNQLKKGKKLSGS